MDEEVGVVGRDDAEADGGREGAVEGRSLLWEGAEVNVREGEDEGVLEDGSGV